MEVIFGVLSIYGSESREKALQRDRIALCDVKESKSDSERLYSFALTRPERNPIHLGVDTENGERQCSIAIFFLIANVLKHGASA